MSGFIRKIKELQLQGTYPFATDALKLLLVDIAAMITAGSANARLVTAATNASPSVLTTASQSWAVGQRVTIAGATGNTAINGRNKINTTPSGTTFTLADIISGAAIAGNGTFGGTCYALNLDLLAFLSDIDATARVSTSGSLTGKTFTLGVFTFSVATFTAVTSGKLSQAVVAYDSTPATDATRPLILVDDAATGLPVLANGGDITYTPHANGNEI